MKFRLDAKVYDQEILPILGEGSYGQVLDAGAYAAKIYHSKPEELQVRKLIKLFDIGAAVQVDQNVAQRVALPLLPAFDMGNSSLAGFGMNRFPGCIKLSKLIFNQQSGEFWRHDGFQFDDERAVRAVFELFGVLKALARRHIAIGDISLANVLVDPKSGRPAVIDMDSVQFEDWESDSQGTDGYVDPDLLEQDLNAAGGYHFDANTDVFAMTVVAFVLFTGFKPFNLMVVPPLSSEEFLRKRISSLRLLVQGDSCLHSHGLQLAQPQLLTCVRTRIDALRRVKGQSGRDGELLYQHFVDVIVTGSRENLLESLSDDDARSAEYQLLQHLRTREVIVELKLKFGLNQPKRTVLATELPSIPRRNRPFVARDPRPFQSFLAARGLELASMVS